MARLTLSLLGPFEVSLAGEPVTGFISDKVRALLAYLAVEADHPHRRESLAGLLWPDWPEPSSRKNLRNALSNLRTAIADRDADPPFLLITRQTIQFNRESDHEFDVAQFESLATGERAEGWAEAMALYHGPFLEGFSVGDSAPFEDWERLERERLERLALKVLGKLAGHWEARGDMERALGYARRQVELAPWHEEGHRTIMRTLALSGQRGAALAQYEECCRTLAEELDAEPSAETVALYDRIRAGELARGEERKAAAPPQHNLPAFLTSLIGREQELAEIGERLADPDCRLLTLTGPGGSGKTRLAVEAAAQAVARFEHGVAFCSLVALQSPEAIMPAVARALGLSSYEEGNPRQQLLDYLRNKAMLLVLDNYEHLIEGAELVSDILRAAPQIKILVTSRARLGLAAEYLYPVGALGLLERTPVTLTEWQDIRASIQSSAVRLFVSAAQRAWPGFELTADNLPHVVHVCRLVEGMPLGILLAAAWANVLDPAEIAVELDRDLDFLAAEGGDLPPRQRSMRAVYNHSWRTLTEREREVMQALSLFRGSYTRRAAQEVGATLRELMSLVNRSLVGHTPGGRYEMHRLLRQYAAEKLSQTPDGGMAVRDRHAAYYAAALRGWAEDLKGPQQIAVLAEMEPEIEDARVAFEWAAERRQLAMLDEAAEGLRHFFSVRSRRREASEVFRMAAERLQGTEMTALPDKEHILPVARVPQRRDDPGSAALELRVLARILSYQADFSEDECARQLFDRSLALLDRPELAEHDTRRERAFVLRGQAFVVSEYDRERAQDLYDRSLALYQALGARDQVATVLMQLGTLAWSVGDYDRARQYLAEGIAVRRKLGAPFPVARSLGMLGIVALMQGRLEESERFLRESRATSMQVLSRHGAATYLGWGLLARGKFVEAAQLIGEDIAFAKDRGTRHAFSLTWLAAVEAHMGRYEPGRAHAERALAIRREIGIPQRIACTLMVLSWVSLVRGAYTRAQELLRESVRLYRQVDQRDEGGWAVACLGCAERGLGQRERAWEHLATALRTAVEIHAFFPAVYGLPLAALLLADEGQVARAVEVYAVASSQPLVGNSVWFEDVVGRQIAAAAEGLPPQVVVAAQERGRARDLWATAEELLAE